MSPGTPHISVVTVTKTQINFPAISVRPRTPSSIVTRSNLVQLDLTTLSPSQALVELTKLRKAHDDTASRRQLFRNPQTARPADAALMRATDSKPLPMKITSDDNDHSMMIGFNEVLSRRQTFVAWTNATHLVLQETLSDGNVRSTTFDILVDRRLPRDYSTEAHLNAIAAARWSTDQQRAKSKAKSQDGDSIQFSSTVLVR